MRGFIGHLEEGGFLPHNHKIYLWAHLHFNIEYNEDQVRTDNWGGGGGFGGEWVGECNLKICMWAHLVNLYFNIECIKGKWICILSSNVTYHIIPNNSPLPNNSLCHVFLLVM